MSRPPLSVVISCTAAWPGGEACLRSVLPQAQALGAEVIAVATGPHSAAPAVECVRQEVVPGGSPFALRARGADVADGEVIAFVEDHVVVADGWADAILRAHAERPETALIGGTVRNGTAESRWDRANYLATFGPTAPPADAGAIPSIANCAYKRAALPEGPLGEGWMELGISLELHAAGRTAFDPRPVVVHVQAHGFGALAHHFDNGRACAGIPSAGWPLRRRGRAVRPRTDLGSIARRTRAAARRCPRDDRATLLLVALLAAAHVAGSWTGLLVGTGGSAARVD